MLFKYLKLYKGYFFWYLGITGILLTVTITYHSLSEPVLYTIGIYSFVAAIIGGIEYLKFSKKFQMMNLLLHNLPKDEIKFLETNSIFELQYQQLTYMLQQREKSENLAMENATRSRDDYFTMWVHQIKTPISAIQLIVQEEQGRLDDGSEITAVNQYEIYQGIRQELFKTEQYVQMVLHYIRMEQMSGDLELVNVPVKPMVYSIVKKYSILFFYKKITIDIKELNLEVLTDEKWCSFIIEQIISNAVKYSKEKGKIKIATRKEKELVFEDFGIGIRAEDIHRIFERGFTGYNGRMYEKATGLGLYLSKKIADKLAMKISIESEVSKGTKVILSFPTDKLEFF